MNLLYSRKFYLRYPKACLLLSKVKKENPVKKQVHTFSHTLYSIMLVHWWVSDGYCRPTLFSNSNSESSLHNISIPRQHSITGEHIVYSSRILLLSFHTNGNQYCALTLQVKYAHRIMGHRRPLSNDVEILFVPLQKGTAEWWLYSKQMTQPALQLDFSKLSAHWYRNTSRQDHVSRVATGILVLLPLRRPNFASHSKNANPQIPVWFTLFNEKELHFPPPPHVV